MNQLEARIRNGLQTKEELPLRGLHIVVDAGNGAGGFYAKLMQRLGADTAGSQFLEPDGMFPNHIPNPENPVAMESVSARLLRDRVLISELFLIQIVTELPL